MRNMSFSMTEVAYLDGSKTVTRRLGWKFLKVGDVVMAVRKSQGLKKDEKVVKLGPFRVVNKRRERLVKIDKSDCAREGFRDMHPWHFAEMFCREMKCRPDIIVTRIEFERILP